MRSMGRVGATATDTYPNAARKLASSGLTV